jgi:predicted transcriptional regulator
LGSLTKELNGMAEKRDPAQLGRREREILEIVFRLEEASVGDVVSAMADPPAYDSVRTMLRLLERKGFVRHRRDGAKYVYRPTQSKTSVSRSALSHLMATFFENSVADTMAAVLDLKSDDLSDSELAKLQKLIDQARKEGR